MKNNNKRKELDTFIRKLDNGFCIILMLILYTGAIGVGLFGVHICMNSMKRIVEIVGEPIAYFSCITIVLIMSIGLITGLNWFAEFLDKTSYLRRLLLRGFINRTQVVTDFENIQGILKSVKSDKKGLLRKQIKILSRWSKRNFEEKEDEKEYIKVLRSTDKNNH